MLPKNKKRKNRLYRESLQYAQLKEKCEKVLENYMFEPISKKQHMISDVAQEMYLSNTDWGDEFDDVLDQCVGNVVIPGVNLIISVDEVGIKCRIIPQRKASNI